MINLAGADTSRAPPFSVHDAPCARRLSITNLVQGSDFAARRAFPLVLLAAVWGHAMPCHADSEELTSPWQGWAAVVEHPSCFIERTWRSLSVNNNHWFQLWILGLNTFRFKYEGNIKYLFFRLQDSNQRFSYTTRWPLSISRSFFVVVLSRSVFELELLRVGGRSTAAHSKHSKAFKRSIQTKNSNHSKPYIGRGHGTQPSCRMRCPFTVNDSMALHSIDTFSERAWCMQHANKTFYKSIVPGNCLCSLSLCSTHVLPLILFAGVTRAKIKGKKNTKVTLLTLWKKTIPWT